MSLQKVSLRLPTDVVDAYDAAADRSGASRSELMRRPLVEAVADGEVDVPDDLAKLAQRELAVDRGKEPRKRGTFKKRLHEFYGDHYRSGAVTPTDAEAMSESWRTEAVLYGREQVAYLDALLEWYADHWQPSEADRAEWPDPGTFFAIADPESVDIGDELAERIASDLRREDSERAEVVDAYARYHPRERVEAAAARVDGGEA